MEIGSAIEHAHSRGLIHRDLKTGKYHDLVQVAMWWLSILAWLQISTMTNGLPPVAMPCGLPLAMAPEQMFGKTVDERIDIFALGQILPRNACGTQQSTALVGSTPSRMRGAPPMPSPLRRIIACAVEEDPNWRYPSMAAFMADLNRYRAREPVYGRQKPKLPTWWTKLRQSSRLSALILIPILGAIVWFSFDPIRRSGQTNTLLPPWTS